jgi:hypothetical protein
VGSNVTLWTVTGPVTGHPYGVTGTAFSIPVTGVDLQALRNAFPPKTMVYAIAYGESFYENSFPDPNSGKPVYPNVCTVPSAAVPFNMPP